MLLYNEIYSCIVSDCFETEIEKSSLKHILYIENIILRNPNKTFFCLNKLSLCFLVTHFMYRVFALERAAVWQRRI